MKSHFKHALALVAFGAACLPGIVRAQSWPGTFLEARISALQSPVAITHAGDGSGRIFIAEQRGVVRVFQNGALLPAPLLTISPKVLFAGERGLLGLAFPPNFAGKQYFYVYYTSLTGANVVARYAVSADPNVADPASEQILLTLPHPTFANHNGGQLAFSPKDGFLYVGTGDGGGVGDPFNNAQNPQSLLGKILRLDVESAPAPGNTYVIPPTNPFVGVVGFRQELWALGLRNPWRFSFDRLAGDLYVGDVGQGVFEEVDFQEAASAGGENYGWNILEGPACFNPPNCGPPPGYVPPVMSYDHTEGIAIVGGYVYRGAKFGLLGGIYFFGDLNGKIWGLRWVAGVWQRQLLLNPGFPISTFGEDESGNVYVADYSSGTVHELMQVLPGARVVNDFDADGRSDIGCYFPPGGSWFGFNSTAGLWQTQFGYAGTIPVTGDFDGDGKSDIGVYDPDSGSWNGFNSAIGIWHRRFGFAGTIPVVGDFDGDGRSDIGVYHPDSGNWFTSKSTEGFWQRQFGFAGTIPVTGDLDGDGSSDIGVYHPDSGNWYALKSTEGFWQMQFGFAGTIPVVGDFDGDGKGDIGVYYPPEGAWYVVRSTAGFRQTQFGFAGAEPVVGDFDGDGTSDIGVYYAPGGDWYMLKSTEGFLQTQFGFEGTIPFGATIR
jgi:glucose/arabinose dehydrogenase